MLVGRHKCTSAGTKGVLRVKVRDGMSHLVLTIGPAHTLRQAARMMSARRIGAAVVIDPEHAGIGILTERDILGSVAAGEDPDAELAAQHRTEEPPTPRPTGPWNKPPRRWSRAGSGTSSWSKVTTWPGCFPSRHRPLLDVRRGGQDDPAGARRHLGLSRGPGERVRDDSCSGGCRLESSAANRRRHTGSRDRAGACRCAPGWCAPRPVRGAAGARPAKCRTLSS